eukprot:TRINITY_DN6146_c0_g1_i3.p1 TRINITY_DN6146_c0_g1~~TRINITY_DN6146_c0_g1_i3.p1  ORF type:complete len:1638 (+),score=304.64 TRINITY_DN6146_c0_g1_i3:69-4982(+)
MTDTVKVVVRVRPPSSREVRNGFENAVSMQGLTTTATRRDGSSKSWSFDRGYMSSDRTSSRFSSQQTVAEEIGREILQQALEGFNGCFFAYGQTGSGKSYSVLGTKEAPGIIPWTLDHLFMEHARFEADHALGKEMSVWVSYLEIYNENIHDLLAPEKRQRAQSTAALKVHENPKLGTYVPGLLEEPCNSSQEVQALLDYGTKKRIVSATHMNADSSRSHAVFSVKVHIFEGDRPLDEASDVRKVLTAKLNLIDLAGSERQLKQHLEAQRQYTWDDDSSPSSPKSREGCHINKSLSALGLVIKELSSQLYFAENHEGTPRARGPSGRAPIAVSFRASKLTFLLKDSLAGNSKTCMMATISPAALQVEETISTLRFAASVKKIKTVATRNLTTKEDLVSSLRSELEKVRKELEDAKQLHSHRKSVHLGFGNLTSEAGYMDRKRSENRVRRKTLEAEHLQQLMKEIDTTTIAEDAEEGHVRSLERAREQFHINSSVSADAITSALGVDQSIPYLLNLSNDPSLSGCLLYYLVEKKPITVGSDDSNIIQLSGIGIADRLCKIENDAGEINVTKLSEDGRVVMNGSFLRPGTQYELRHGHHIFFGHAFAMKIVVPQVAEEYASSEAEDTLEGLDAEATKVLEQLPAWQVLQGALQQAVCHLSIEEARSVIDMARYAVTACDEANEITLACRPNEGTRFEVVLTTGEQVTAIVAVCRHEKAQHFWTVDQMAERLESMRTYYHAWQLSGRMHAVVREEHDDPWTVSVNSKLLERLAALEAELDDMSDENLLLKHHKERVAGRFLLLWQDTMGTNALRLTFDAWSQKVREHRHRTHSESAQPQTSDREQPASALELPIGRSESIAVQPASEAKPAGTPTWGERLRARGGARSGSKPREPSTQRAAIKAQSVRGGGAGGQAAINVKRRTSSSASSNGKQQPGTTKQRAAPKHAKLAEDVVIADEALGRTANNISDGNGYEGPQEDVSEDKVAHWLEEDSTTRTEPPSTVTQDRERSPWRDKAFMTRLVSNLREELSTHTIQCERSGIDTAHVRQFHQRVEGLLQHFFEDQGEEPSFLGTNEGTPLSRISADVTFGPGNTPTNLQPTLEEISVSEEASAGHADAAEQRSIAVNGVLQDSTHYAAANGALHPVTEDFPALRDRSEREKQMPGTGSCLKASINTPREVRTVRVQSPRTESDVSQRPIPTEPPIADASVETSNMSLSARTAAVLTMQGPSTASHLAVRSPRCVTVPYLQPVIPATSSRCLHAARAVTPRRAVAQVAAAPGVNIQMQTVHYAVRDEPAQLGYQQRTPRQASAVRAQSPHAVTTFGAGTHTRASSNSNRLVRASSVPRMFSPGRHFVPATNLTQIQVAASPRLPATVVQYSPRLAASPQVFLGAGAGASWQGAPAEPVATTVWAANPATQVVVDPTLLAAEAQAKLQMKPLAQQGNSQHWRESSSPLSSRMVRAFSAGQLPRRQQSAGTISSSGETRVAVAVTGHQPHSRAWSPHRVVAATQQPICQELQEPITMRPTALGASRAFVHGPAALTSQPEQSGPSAEPQDGSAPDSAQTSAVPSVMQVGLSCNQSERHRSKDSDVPAAPTPNAAGGSSVSSSAATFSTRPASRVLESAAVKTRLTGQPQKSPG